MEEIVHCHQHEDDAEFVTCPHSFLFEGEDCLGFMGSLKLCVTPCSSFPYPPFPNHTMLATLLKVMLFNQVHACLLMKEENIGLTKQG